MVNLYVDTPPALITRQYTFTVDRMASKWKAGTSVSLSRIHEKINDRKYLCIMPAESAAIVVPVSQQPVNW